MLMRTRALDDMLYLIDRYAPEEHRRPSVGIQPQGLPSLLVHRSSSYD